jgi:hypothetical protein
LVEERGCGCERYCVVAEKVWSVPDARERKVKESEGVDVGREEGRNPKKSNVRKGLYIIPRMRL